MSIKIIKGYLLHEVLTYKEKEITIPIYNKYTGVKDCEETDTVYQIFLRGKLVVPQYDRNIVAYQDILEEEEYIFSYGEPSLGDEIDVEWHCSNHEDFKISEWPVIVGKIVVEFEDNAAIPLEVIQNLPKLEDGLSYYIFTD